jgi:phosphatidylserine/phosphatidylglycerophosphate/cardiolipin synthase-like enzyme
MKKHKESIFELSLLEAWTPPDEAGAPVAVIATTYEFDPHLWEFELMPRFLGLETDVHEDVDPFWIEHETRLAELSCAAVLVDGSNLSKNTKSPLWDQIGVYVKRGILHSKIVLLQWEHCVRIVVGSANLTKSGYRFNYELFYVLDFKNDTNSPPRALLLSFIEAIRHIAKHTSDELLKHDPARQRLFEALKNCQLSVAQWNKMPGSYRPRADFKLEAILIEPGLPRQNNNLIAQLFKAWGNQKASWIRIMSPFWDSPESGSKYSPMTALLPHLQSGLVADFVCSGEWIRPEKEAEINMPQMVVKQILQKTEDVCFCPVIKDKDRVPNSDKRNLHAKSLMLYNNVTDSQILYVGSSNFTKRGTGMVSANYESGVALVRRNYTVNDLDALLPGTSQNISLDAKQIHYKKLLDQGKEELESYSSYPSFDILAEYDAGKKALIVNVFSDSSLPSHHLAIIRLDSDSRAQVSDLLLSFSPGKASPYPIKKILEYIPMVLELKWGENHSVLIPVQVKARHELPYPEALRNIALDDLLDYLASSRPVWKFSRQRIMSKGSGGDIYDPHKIVNTQGYMTSQVKRFSKAMAGLRRRMTDYQSTSMEGLRARFFSPFGPWSLLKAICHLVNMDIDENNHLNLVDGSVNPPTASYNLVAFLSTELLLILKWIPFTKIYQGPYAPAAKREWQKMIAQIEKVTSQLARFKEVDVNLQSYIQLVKQEK